MKKNHQKYVLHCLKFSSDGAIHQWWFLFYFLGLTRIDRALLVAYDDLFGPSGSSRRGVQKIAIVLTDGKQTAASNAVALDKVM